MKKISFAAVLALVALLCGCGKSTAETLPASGNSFVLNTIASITIYESDGKEKPSELINEAFSICENYERLLSRTIEESDVGKLNKGSGEPVLVSDETKYLIEQAIYYSEISDGAFDITIAPASILWDFASDNPSPPDNYELTEALKHINYKNICFEENGISLKNGAKIDLGGIAKGYIADKLSEYLKEHGVKSAIINLGGNIYALGSKNGGAFSIGIQKPFGGVSELSGVVHVSDTSVVTSGTYERYFEYEGKIYHHILDPKTGMPVYNDIESVTIICHSSLSADALSTAAFVLGSEKGLQLIESLKDTEAVFILSNGEILTTSGIGSKIKFDEN
ncbi:MAG: FAD:protein FMN transferase [Lachnospiraceae bacterium]|nr:FAD:protein FMN transferase [Lachnospiraceae bacterium]